LGETENEPENRGIGESEKEASFVFFTSSPTRYRGWLDKNKRLSNRAYFVIDKEGIVRFKKVMEKPREILPVLELEKALEGL
jgi:hypothetical protein